MVRVLTPEQYREVVNEQDSDYCDCCGGLYRIAGLVEAQMPDLDRPEVVDGRTYYPLLGGLNVCHGCSDHCEDGPCTPDNLVIVLPWQLILAEHGQLEPRTLGVNTMNVDHDDERWIPDGWKAWTSEGTIYHQAEQKSEVEAWLIKNGFRDTGDGSHYQRPIEYLLWMFPSNLLPTVEKAEEYAKGLVGGLHSVEVGDKYSALPEFYEIQKWLILSTRVVVDRQEPLTGRILGQCVYTGKQRLTDAEKRELAARFAQEHQHAENQRVQGLADKED